MAPTVASLAKELENLSGTFETKMKELLMAITNSKKELVQENKEEFKALQQELESLKKSMSVISDSFDDLRTAHATLVTENKELRKQNELLSHQVQELDQYSRLNNLEIRGVPQTQGEDCLKIIQKIGDKIGSSVKVEDIDAVHRVSTRDAGKRNLIVRFCSRAKRTDFLRKARKARLTTGKLGFSGSNDTAIYVNEHLTPLNKKLFAMALEQKKQTRWLYLWTENCVIKARKNADGKVFRIRSESDLHVFHDN